jgi:hypothetical protein
MSNNPLTKKEQFNRNIEICHKILKYMKKRFTSDTFGMRLRSAGVNESFIHNDYMRNFLYEHCDKVEGKRSWVKKIEKLPSTELQITFVNTESETDLEKAIQIVKNSGQYKVYKLQQEWKEI